MQKIIRWVVAGALVALVLIEGGRIGSALLDLRDGSSMLRAAARALGSRPQDWSDRALVAAADGNQRAAARLARGDALLHSDPLVRIGLRVPYASDQVRAVLTLSGAAIAASGTLDDLVAVAGAYRSVSGASFAPGVRLLALLQASGHPLADARDRLRPAVRDLHDVAASRRLLAPLRRRVESALAVLGPAASQAADGARAAANAPAALGAVTPRTYLLLFNNPSEERPGGGYTGAMGSVRLAGGAPSSLEVHEQGDYSKAQRQRLPVPYPLSRYLKFYRDSLEFGDAGWDPDFPTSARLYEQMYTSATQKQVDGTIALDPYAVAAFLRVTGAVDVPGYGTFDASNFFAKLNTIVNASTAANGGQKALGPIAQTVLQRIISSPVTDWPALLAAFQQQAGERHIQLWLHDPALAGQASEARWDGALIPTASDYLLVADGNVGATKGDYFVRKTVELAVDVLPGGLARHHLKMRYEMPPPVDAVDRALNPAPGDYVDFARIYLPVSAVLDGVHYAQDGGPGDGGLDSQGTDHGRRYVAVAFRLPRGHRAEVEVTYDDTLDMSAGYSLYLQKEAGSLATPVDLVVTRGAVSWHRSFDLRVDRELRF